jgi:hypothetical protein
MDDQRTNRAGGRGLIPRFSLLTLLVAATFIAVWFSTFYRYQASSDVRALIAIILTISPGAAALYSDGARRAFWGGFCVTMFAMSNRQLLSWAPRFSWAINKPGGWGPLFTDDRTQWSQIQDFVNATVVFGCWLILASIMGAMCVFIRSRCLAKK